MAVPKLVIDPNAKHEGDPVVEFVKTLDFAGNDTLDIEVVYVGYEAAPDALTVNTEGEVLAASS